jgi:hypothetical protein
VLFGAVFAATGGEGLRRVAGLDDHASGGGPVIALNLPAGLEPPD